MHAGRGASADHRVRGVVRRLTIVRGVVCQLTIVRVRGVVRRLVLVCEKWRSMHTHAYLVSRVGGSSVGINVCVLAYVCARVCVRVGYT